MRAVRGVIMASPLSDLALKVVARVQTTCSCLFYSQKPLPRLFSCDLRSVSFLYLRCCNVVQCYRVGQLGYCRASKDRRITLCDVLNLLMPTTSDTYFYILGCDYPCRTTPYVPQPSSLASKARRLLVLCLISRRV